MKKRTARKNITSFFLVLAMILTMRPVPVQAAAVSISPSGNSNTIYVGATFKIKPKGSYKKVTWKSNRKALTVTQKGVVTAKKAGYAEITATFTLKNNKKVKKYCSFEIENSDRIIEVADATDSLAKEIHGYLTSNKPFSLVYYGKQDKAIEVIQELREKIGKINEYGVLFQYDDSVSTLPGAFPAPYPCNTGWLFHVTKNDCKLYNYSVKFYKQVVEDLTNCLFCDDFDEENDNYVFYPNGKLVYARSFSTWQDYEAALKADKSYSMCPNSCETSNARQCWLLANNKFYDLSQAMQVWVVSKQGFFSGGTTLEDRTELGLFGMTYAQTTDGGESHHESDVVRMKNMAENIADGTCGDFANYEVTAFTQLGIEAEYQGDGGHAWSVVYPYNADGQKLKLIFNWHLWYGNDSSHGTSDTEDMIY